MPKLSGPEIARIDRMVSDPRFEVHVGRDDGEFRRIAGQMRFRDGRDTGRMTFSLDYRDVDRPVRIEAPRGQEMHPIDELLGQLGAGPSGRRGRGSTPGAWRK